MYILNEWSSYNCFWLTIPLIHLFLETVSIVIAIVTNINVSHNTTFFYFLLPGRQPNSITINVDKGPKLKHQRNSHNVNENDEINAKENGLTTRETLNSWSYWESKM